MKVEVLCEVLKGDKGKYWTRGTVLSDPLPSDIKAELKAGRRTVRVIEEKSTKQPDPPPAPPSPPTKKKDESFKIIKGNAGPGQGASAKLGDEDV